MTTPTHAIKPFSEALKRMMDSIWKLLLINTLVLCVALYTLIFTDAHRHKDFYLNDFILNGLLLYLSVFPCFKSFIHLTSLCIFRTQLNYHKLQIAESISEHDYILYIKKPLRKIQTLLLLYPLVLLAHGAIAFACYYLKTHCL